LRDRAGTSSRESSRAIRQWWRQTNGREPAPQEVDVRRALDRTAGPGFRKSDALWFTCDGPISTLAASISLERPRQGKDVEGWSPPRIGNSKSTSAGGAFFRHSSHEPGHCLRRRFVVGSTNGQRVAAIMDSANLLPDVDPRDYCSSSFGCHQGQGWYPWTGAGWEILVLEAVDQLLATHSRCGRWGSTDWRNLQGIPNPLQLFVTVCDIA
jgi:hypothetical protein